VLINVPISDGLMPLLLGRRWYGYQHSQHVHQFTRRGLREIARRAGLQPLTVTSESLHYTHRNILTRNALVAAATIGRTLRRGDQSTLVATLD
jgi:hypothetical protein